ncbi:MAG: SMI1/KNR4 family protein [Sandaracinus sp.]|nr:SMI1/KNR4 family protein [Sandaracinus sp.]
MNDLARRVLETWRAAGVARDDDESLRDFEANLEKLRARGVRLPPSFVALWRLSDGTAAMDDHEMIFWPLDNVLDDPSRDPSSRDLVFADYRLGSTSFFLRLEGDAASVHRVRDSRPETSERVAESFEDFLERYLQAPVSLR